MRRLIALSFVAALTATACAATAPIRWAPRDEFSLTIVDNIAQKRFDLALTSSASHPLCMPREAWPTAEAVPAGFDGAILVTPGGKKNLLPTGSAYCPGGCGEIRVNSGKTLLGALPYSAFGNIVDIAAEPMRTLIIEAHPYYCRSG